MSRLKKLISVLLVLSLSVFANVFAAEDSGAEYTKSMKFLMAADILQNHTIEDAANKVSRIEFAKIIARIVFPDDNYYWSSERQYSDVVAEYTEITSALADQNIMIGYDESTFAPDQPITYNEVLKSLVSLTGYDIQAINAGGYPNGYTQTASSIGILKNFAGRSNRELTLGEISKLIENALKIDIMTITVSGGKVEYSTADGDNLLKRKFDIYEGEGLISATEFTNIYGGAYAPKNSVLIGDYAYELKDKTIEEFLGHRVEFYYTADDEYSSDRALISVENVRTVETLSILSPDIVGFEDKVYTYTDADNVRDRKAKLADDAMIMYNYRLPETKSGDELYLPSEGKIDLIDNDGDGKYEIIFIWDYETCVVNDVSAESFKVGDYYGVNALDLDPDVVDYRIIKNGEQIGIEALEKWNVLSVAESDDSEPYITIIVSDKRVTGQLSSYDGEYAEIDGVRYKISSAFTQKINISETFDYYIDAVGCIAVYDKNSGSEYAYHGIITGYRFLNDDFESAPEIKIYTEDGVFTWYQTNEKISLDGINSQKSCKVFGAQVAESEAEASENVLMNRDGIIPQMISYKLSKNGNIRSIDTVDKTDAESEDSLNQSQYFPSRSGYQYMLLGHTWSDMIAMANGLTIFKAPSDVNGNILKGNEYDKYYEIMQWGVWNNPFYDHYDTYSVRFFNVNESQVSDLMIWYNPVDGSDAQYGSVVMVKDISTALNADDEIVMQLDGWSEGQEVHIPVESGKEDRVSDLRRGQLIRYALNKQDELSEVQMFTDAAGKAVNVLDPDQNYFLSSATVYERTRCLYGEITSIDRDNNVIVVKYQQNENGQATGDGIVNVLKGESGHDADVLIYNLKTGKMENGTWSDLRLGQKVVLDKCETAVRSITIIGAN